MGTNRFNICKSFTSGGCLLGQESLSRKDESPRGVVDRQRLRNYGIKELRVWLIDRTDGPAWFPPVPRFGREP